MELMTAMKGTVTITERGFHAEIQAIPEMRRSDDERRFVE